MNEIVQKDPSQSVPDIVPGMSRSEVERLLAIKRRQRVVSEDIHRRVAYLGAGTAIAAPWAAVPFITPAMESAVNASPFISIIAAMGGAAMIMFPPVLIIGSFFKSRERKELDRGQPIYIPATPTLSDGTLGEPWRPGQQDVIFERTSAVISAIDDGSSPEELRFHVGEFARRAQELVVHLPIHRPVSGGRHHYWPNRHVVSEIDDRQTISYDDNLPVEGQRGKVRAIMQELRHDLDQVERGTDPFRIVPSVLDLVAAVRRVLELSGRDASLLREKPQPIALAEPKAKGLLRDTPHVVRAALDLVKRATDLDADAVDGLGNRIEPLNGHVMRILSTYREACEIADEEQRAVLSSQLEEAMEHVAAAAQQGIDLHQKARLERFGTELRFIASRNGDHS